MTQGTTSIYLRHGKTQNTAEAVADNRQHRIRNIPVDCKDGSTTGSLKFRGACSVQRSVLRISMLTLVEKEASLVLVLAAKACNQSTVGQIHCVAHIEIL